MAIRPVEVQGVVQRSQDIGQLKQNQDQKPMVDQSNIQVQMHQETKHNMQQVSKFQNADKKESRYDAKEKGNGAYFGNRKKQEKHTIEEEEDNDSVILKSVHKGSFDTKI